MRHDEYCKSHDGIAAARIRGQRVVQTGIDGKRYVSLGDESYRPVRVTQADEHGGGFHRRLEEAFSLPYHGPNAG